MKYREMEIPGKHGEIVLRIPDEKPTKEEWNEIHRVIAETIIDSEKRKRSDESKKAAN